MNKQLPVVESGRAASKQSDKPIIYTTPEYSTQRDGDDDEIDLRELLLVVRRRKGMIILIALLVFCAAFFVTLKIQPTYRATATIQIDSEDSAQVLSFDVGISGDSSNSEFYQTQYELIQSRVLASRVINELGLNDQLQSGAVEQSLVSQWLSSLKTLVNGSETSSYQLSLGEYPVESKFLAGLSVAPVKKSRIVAINYDSYDPVLATKAANSVAENFIQMTLERRQDAGRYAHDFLSDKVDEEASKLRKLEEKLNDYAKSESIIQTGDENSQSLISQKTGELNLAWAKSENSLIEAEAEYKRLQNSLSASKVLSSPSIQELKSIVIKLEGEYQRGLQTYKPSYPSMISLKRQINQFKNQLDRETRIVDSTTRELLKDEYLAAKEKENKFYSKLELQKQGLLELRDKKITYDSLLRQVVIQRKVYEGLLQRSTEVTIASGIGTNNVAVVDKAILPYQQQKPNTKLNLALGGVLGVFIGLVVAFLLEFMDDRVKSTDELKRILGLALLGSIPDVKERDPIKNSLETATNPASAMAEAFRSLRTNLLFSSTEGVPKIIAITSAAPSEGKSSSCLNLASAFAQSNTKVLLIDADMRKPTAHKRLKLDNSIGLSNYLTSQADIDDVIQETFIKGVWSITAGPMSPNPAELLSSPRLQGIFNLAPSRFDLIIIDCPPIIGLADALILANRADATLMVTAFNQTGRRIIQDSYEKLRQARANVIGSVFSKVKSGGGYGYSYEYSTYYSYGAEKLENG